VKNSITDQIQQMGRQARTAAYALAKLSSDEKKAILRAMAGAVRAATPDLIAENAKDLAAAREKGLSSAMIDRLKLDQARVEAMAVGIDEVAALPDPVGQVIESWQRPNGICIEQVRVPIGTIGIIYESRPNVTADAAVLCFKTGNATILRGGSEAIHSNVAIAKVLDSVGAPPHSIQLIPFTDRESVSAMAQMDKWLDLIIPRGGKGLIETVVSQARMPVIKHYDGVCHLFVDRAADIPMALDLTIDAKTQKPGVCNALETLLVHRDIAQAFLPAAAAALRARGVELRGCDATRTILADALPATDDDWSAEYLDLILAIRVVGSLDEAIDHANTFGSHHTDVIVTADGAAAERFLREVDSACVFHNVSNRFADGGEFGFGAEIGISTDKLHARGPMGLRELTSYQYRVRGSGQTKAPVVHQA
jgi:glutamate-5-semialdehyde dehydrogenase